MPEQEEKDQDYEEPSENYCDFSIFVKDTHSNTGMIVEATSMDTEIAFNNVMHADDMAKAMKLARFERSI